jgi:uncharacterized protein with NRDE domain
LVTNLRGYGVADPSRASRGGLVTGLLTGELDPTTVDLEPYNPFNLVLADRTRATFLSNRPGPLRTELASGVYGLSNGALDEPWPKTLQLKAALLEWIMRGDTEVDPLFDALARQDLPEYGIHPDQPSDIPREAPDTPVFIRDQVYGTRCSTVVTIDAHGAGMATERSFDPRGKEARTVAIPFSWKLS